MGRFVRLIKKCKLFLKRKAALLASFFNKLRKERLKNIKMYFNKVS